MFIKTKVRIHAAHHKLAAWAHCLSHKAVHRMHWCAHSSYLGLVAYEAHGSYRYAAGVLLVVTVIGALAGTEVAE